MFKVLNIDKENGKMGSLLTKMNWQNHHNSSDLNRRNLKNSLLYFF